MNNFSVYVDSHLSNVEDSLLKLNKDVIEGSAEKTSTVVRTLLT